MFLFGYENELIRNIYLDDDRWFIIESNRLWFLFFESNKIFIDGCRYW